MWQYNKTRELHHGNLALDTSRIWAYNHTQQNELYHHGILGMRWGVRRYQNSDGSLTKAGERRYNEGVEKAKADLKEAKFAKKQATIAYDKATFYGLKNDDKALNKLVKANHNVKYAKEDLTDAKVKVKLDSSSKKSKRQLQLEQKYKEQGMNQEEAAIAAYKRAKTEKILMVTGGLAVAGLVAYGAYKYHDNNVDKIIKSGTVLQNISNNSNKGVADAFYSSRGLRDNMMYRGAYGVALLEKGDVYETKIGVNSALKVASRNSATKALSELVKNDSDYTNNLKSALNDYLNANVTDRQRNVIKKALNSLESGKVNSKVYDAANIALANHGVQAQSASNQFYNALKSKGYDAIKDMNDSKYSGYGTNSPHIIFNGASKLAVKSSREVGLDEIVKNSKLAATDYRLREKAPKLAKIGSIVAGGKAVVTYAQAKTDDKIFKEYKEQRPNTTMTKKEIVREYRNKEG
ncbi:hypothetical protein AGMMS49975_25780 [Clostridia bacterium]|nr:hypothetical protein AGMMS49975_25780 [Clostridia bacterium]